MDYDKEIEFLDTILKQVQEKFISQWTGAQFDNALSQQAKTHSEAMDKYRGTDIPGMILLQLSGCLIDYISCCEILLIKSNIHPK